MDSEGNAYFTNLLHGGSNIDNEFSANDYDEIGQYSNELNITAPEPPKVRPTNKAQRSRNFTTKEDILLISAWLNISMDAVHGNKQKSTTYWKRIHDYFHENKNFESNRSQNSLTHRWSGMQLEVNKFCGHYAQVARSGITEQDKIFEATALYEKCERRSFQFLHCWHELRHHPKWSQDYSKKKKKTSNNASHSMSSPSTPDSINLGEDNVANDVTERPMGKKASKARIRKNTDCGSENSQSKRPTSVILEEYKDERAVVERKRDERFERMYAQQQEMLELEKEKVRLKAIKEEQRIMSIDTTSMDPLQAQYYESLKMEIVAKRVGSSFS